MFYAAVEQPPIVLGFSQRVAVETLFRYCAMEKNPFYVEREKKRLQQEKRIKKILEKKGEDLTPFQQIELLKHTFDLSFADKLVAKTLKAFIVSWVCLAALELWWRGYCRQQFRAQKKQEDREKDKWVTYEEDFEIKLKGALAKKTRVKSIQKAVSLGLIQAQRVVIYQNHLLQKVPQAGGLLPRAPWMRILGCTKRKLHFRHSEKNL